MAMMEQAPRQVAVKISPEGDRLITSGAHYLHMSKKDLVEAAVAFYLDARSEVAAGQREEGSPDDFHASLPVVRRQGHDTTLSIPLR